VRFASLVFCLLLLRGAAMASGTVSFNLHSYGTPGFPWVTEDFAVTTGIALADFNRDGIPDLAYTFPGCDASSSCAGVIVKLGTGGGNLGPDVFYAWGAQSLGELVAADFNSDGWLDIMVRDVNGSGLFLLRNNGDGTFQWVGATRARQPFIGSFTVGDFNHDGKIDLAQINCDRQNGGFPFGIALCALYISLGDGTGQFTQTQSLQLKAGAAYNLQSADINGDGNLDLVYVRTTYDGTLNQYSGVGAIWWGRGDGTFPSATYLKPAITNSLDGLAIADFNNDGRLDAVGIGKRQRAEQDSVDYAEHGGGRADAERECHYCDGCKGSVLKKHADSEGKVLSKDVHAISKCELERGFPASSERQLVSHLPRVTKSLIKRFDTWDFHKGRKVEDCPHMEPSVRKWTRKDWEW